MSLFSVGGGKSLEALSLECTIATQARLEREVDSVADELADEAFCAKPVMMSVCG